MKSVKSNIFRVVKVNVNTSNRKSHQWGEIVDVKTGKVLHRGQLKHIRYTAKKRYNTTVTI